MSPSIGEAETRPRDEVAHCLRDEDFAWAGFRGDAGSDCYREAGYLAVVNLAFSNVNADPRFQSDRANAFDDRLCRPDGPRRPVECDKEAVAGGVALLPSESAELATHDRMMPSEKIPPGAITDLHDPLRRADDVCEHHRRQNALGYLGHFFAVNESLDFVSDLRREDWVEKSKLAL